MDITFERKFHIHQWIIKNRWIYVAGVLLVGIVTKSEPHTNLNFQTWEMLGLFGVMFLVNYLFYYLVNHSHTANTIERLDYLGVLALAIEMVFGLVVIYKAGGIESVAIIFFLLPIITSSLLFGFRGSVITAVVSGLLVFLLVWAEFQGFVPHIDRYIGFSNIETTIWTIALNKVFGIAIFYMIIGVAAGQSARLLYSRERLYRETSEKLLDINREFDKKIQEQKKAERAIMAAFSDLKRERLKTETERKKTEAIFNNLVDPVIFIDNEHRISLVNPAVRLAFATDMDIVGFAVDPGGGYSLENFRTIFRLPYEVKRVENHEGPYQVEELVLKTASRDLNFKVMTVEVRDDGNAVVGYLKIFYNLTREKMVDKMKSEFISVAAHQLRTPLSAIKWVIKMVLDGDAGPLNQDQTELLDKGYKSNERIINVVNDLLNVSRIEEGRFGYDMKDADFALIVQAAVDDVLGLVEQGKLKLEIKLPKDLPLARFDREKMLLVMQNLLENAIKYTPEGGRVTVAVEPAGQRLRVSVKDTGVGIPAADQGKIFAKFFRAANVVRMQTEGSGLGLFIAKNIIEHHGGVVVISSVEGIGTEVSFTLPAAPEAT